MQKQWIIGVDEAGRGPLFGPVTTAAVILPDDHDLSGLNDSKKLTAKKRDILFDLIQEKAIAFAIAEATVQEIDTLNIHAATLLAMKRAIVDLLAKLPDEIASNTKILVDGKFAPEIDSDHPIEAVIGGDGLVAEISAASILAKVTRDRLIQSLDAKYPNYGRASHKGYPTKVHLEALREHGVTPLHRQSYAPIRRIVSGGC